MIQLLRRTKFSLSLGVSVVGVLVLVAGWRASLVDHIANGRSELSFVIDCDFDKYRQIMVRKNATGAIVSHSGMKLLSERIEGVELDASADDRPLLNALRGKSKTEVVAVKELKVELNDPTLEASELVLRQDANIREQVIDVQTKSVQAAGRLENYETTLHAEPDADGTRVSLTVDLNVRVRLPVLFKSRADTEVQQAAEDAIAGQRIAMEQFVMKHANDLFIVPELNR